ncbi:MAG: hypothetical protein RIR70_485 [Pseudomonadota bacterium]|jgi:N-acyl amino acid synthase of PEP-CTERM/exosortase system
MMSTPTLSAFGQHFEIIPALDEATRDAAHRIRHAVYCEDLHFEPTRPDGRERDEYDSHSLHCLLRHRASGEFIGVTRLVLPPPGPQGGLLPFERTCGAALYRGPLDPSRLPRETIAEVSRLAVVKDFRRRRGEAQSPLPMSEDDFGTPSRPRCPFIPIGLYLGAIALADKLGIHTLFTLTEPRLAQHFSRFGVAVVQIGEGVAHRGVRIPSMISVPDVLAHMSTMVRPIWLEVEASMREHLHQAAAQSRQEIEARCG